MKLLIKIFFFLDTVVLVVLTYLLLNLIDAGKSGATIAGITIGIFASIGLLVLFVYRYLKSPVSGRER